MIQTYTFNHLLDKMSNSDKDIRFMATNDLLAELQKDTFKVKYEDLWRFRSVSRWAYALEIILKSCRLTKFI